MFCVVLCLFKILVLYLRGYDFFFFLNLFYGYIFLGVFLGERFYELSLFEEKSFLFSCYCQEVVRDLWIEGFLVYILLWKCIEVKFDCKFFK